MKKKKLLLAALLLTTALSVQSVIAQDTQRNGNSNNDITEWSTGIKAGGAKVHGVGAENENINGQTYDNNHAYDGGAIGNYGDMTIENSNFNKKFNLRL